MEKYDIPGAFMNETTDFKEQLKSTEKGETFGVPVNEKTHLTELETLMASFNIGELKVSDTSVNEIGKPKGLEEWKEELVKAEKRKAEMLFSKLAADENKRKVQDELEKLKDLDFKKRALLESHKSNLSLINKQNAELRKENEFLKSKCESVSAQCEELVRSLRVQKRIPEEKIKCRRLENIATEDPYMNISYLFHVVPKIPFKLSQGEALITFEEESVAQEVIRRRSHCVDLENEKVFLQALPVALETGVTFELHVKIPQKKIQVSDIPDVKLPEEWMRDKLELCFWKKKLGGEVQNITYDQRSHMALITFSQPIAANDIAKHGPYSIHAVGWNWPLTVSPITQAHLEKFHKFSGISRKTVLLRGIQTEEEDDENVEDMIAIHFQKPSNGGGEVEKVKYVRKGTKIAYFENDNTSYTV
ncbi:hypothetical protein JRQ81_001710 [Phrynocephalus forsythii]|uniref:N-myc-interactor n=1 Tax=Phrynocephalus forsythii TaxID=171643 RepID=A0A9Q0Y7R0_9SAUR|nr:hypothetical protein JRQ81_001710 [Phrynocephalus forsythii]